LPRYFAKEAFSNSLTREKIMVCNGKVRCFVVLQPHIAKFIVWCFPFTRRSTRFPMPCHLYNDLGGADSRWRDVGAQRCNDDFDDGMDERGEEEVYDYMKYGMISGTQENPRWEFGLNAEVMQGIHPPLQDAKHHAATREMLCRTAKWLPRPTLGLLWIVGTRTLQQEGWNQNCSDQRWIQSHCSWIECFFVAWN
jgi:hypothetical protein